ncbi:MAG TPA: glycosyltransferase [Burkholderiaceae bacterium]|jgi:glycosyltransferase involved in cell wall biosynthesis|nr:glycosyltransferase [Burkholderiaceae bacterium]
MSLPLITVAVCSFNGERYLEKSLNSVLAQDYSNFEVVIVDDGSSDGTVSIIKRFADRHSCIRPFFRSHHGLPASRNFSFAQASGEWIAIIDQDDLCYPTRLSRQLELAQRYPSVGLVFSNVDQVDESDEVIGDHLSIFSLPEHLIRRDYVGNLLLRLGCFTASASCFIKRDAVSAVGAFDESFAYSCDYDYFIRAGFEVDFAYTKDRLVAYRRHAEQATATYGRKGNEIRSLYWRNCQGRNASILTKTVLLGKIFRSFVGDIVRKSRRLLR